MCKLTEARVRGAMQRLFACADNPTQQPKVADVELLLSFRFAFFNGRLPDDFPTYKGGNLFKLSYLAQNAAYVLERNGINPYREEKAQ